MPRTMNKRERLKELARYRREHVPTGYKGIGEYHGGAYECDFVSPYTKSAQELDADIVIVLQDWASDCYFREKVDPNPVLKVDLISKGHDPTLYTNKNIKALLRTHFDMSLAQTYTTNLFPFVKPGKMNAKIEPEELLKAARTYTMREIGLIKPKLVVCCGLDVSRTILEVLGSPWPGSLSKAIESSPFRFGKTEYWAQAHPGGQGLASRGGFDRVSQDWERMSARFCRR